MCLTKRQKIIPRHWMHDYYIINKENKTLKDLMIEYSMPIP